MAWKFPGGFMRTLIHSGILARHDGVFAADVAMENGTVTEIGEHLPRKGTELVDAGGCIVMPGGVDVHTHFTLPLPDAPAAAHCFHTGTAAAALGGTTCIVEHSGFGPDACTLLDPPQAVRAMAEGHAVVDYGVHCVWQPQHRPEEALQAVAAGYASAKVYTTYAGQLDDFSILQVLRAMDAAQGLVTVHCENDAMLRHGALHLKQQGIIGPEAHPLARPSLCEAEAVHTLLALARFVETPLYIVHLSTAEGLNHVRRARETGQTVWAETCPQYLLLDASRYAEAGDAGFQYVMAPPLRAPSDSAALWKGLQNGDIDVVATDHCPFNLADKLRLARGNVFRCPGGIPGVQTRIPLLYSEGVARGRISLPRLVQLAAEAPARIMGLHRKGRLHPGADADVLVLDPTHEVTLTAETLHQGADFTPFAGMTVRGWPRDVWLRGQRIVRNKTLTAEPGCGRFVRRSLHTGAEETAECPPT